MVIGIDVGGVRKGFHAVAMNRQGRLLATVHERDPSAVARWCRAWGAAAVAVDAPCGWSDPEVSPGGRSRACERALAREGIRAYSTPDRATASGNKFYGWVFNAERLYAELAAPFPLLGEPGTPAPVSFESFPHAVATLFSGTRPSRASAKEKDQHRREVLRAQGIDPARLIGPDLVDAALCALAARAWQGGKARAWGDAREGMIITPGSDFLALPRHQVDE